jgi:hypothetical protein
LAIGSDADTVLLDPRAGRVIHKEDLHETDYTSWEGHKVTAWPSLTILRGKIVVENGQLIASPSDGQGLPRKFGDDIRARPAVRRRAAPSAVTNSQRRTSGYANSKLSQRTMITDPQISEYQP